MLSSIYLKTLYNLRFQALGWSLGVGFVAFITMVFYNSFSQVGTTEFLSTIPDSLKPLVGSIDDFKTIPGYIGQQVFGPNGYILAVVASIIMALAVSANEEDDRRLQTLLTLPVTRSAVFCQKWLAVVTAVAIMCVVFVLLTCVGLLVVGQSADSGRLVQSTLAFFLMNTAFATIAFGLAMFTGKKGFSVLLATGYTGLCFIITSLAASVTSLKAIDQLSVLHYYNNPLVMQHGIKVEHVLVLSGVIVAVAAIAWWRFRVRSVST